MKKKPPYSWDFVFREVEAARKENRPPNLPRLAEMTKAVGGR